MRINVANDFAQPIFQSPLQIHIMLGLHRGENTGLKKQKMCFCRTNPRPLLPWDGQSTVAEELLPPKQTWNFLLQALEQMRILRLEPLNMFHWIFSQSFFSLGKISGFLCWWVAASFSHSNLQVKFFPFPWWMSRHGACPSGGEDAGYISALGAWKSRSCLKQSREENSFHHLQKCHTLLKRFTRCSD